MNVSYYVLIFNCKYTTENQINKSTNYIPLVYYRNEKTRFGEKVKTKSYYDGFCNFEQNKLSSEKYSTHGSMYTNKIGITI